MGDYGGVQKQLAEVAEKLEPATPDG